MWENDEKFGVNMLNHHKYTATMEKWAWFSSCKYFFSYDFMIWFVFSYAGTWTCFCEIHRWMCLISVFSDEKCRDKYFNCNVVVQARLCVYDYYQTACCVSCRRVAHQSSGRWRRRSWGHPSIWTGTREKRTNRSSLILFGWEMHLWPRRGSSAGTKHTCGINRPSETLKTLDRISVTNCTEISEYTEHEKLRCERDENEILQHHHCISSVHTASV